MYVLWIIEAIHKCLGYQGVLIIQVNLYAKAHTIWNRNSLCGLWRCCNFQVPDQQVSLYIYPWNEMIVSTDLEAMVGLVTLVFHLLSDHLGYTL